MPTWGKEGGGGGGTERSAVCKSAGVTCSAGQPAARRLFFICSSGIFFSRAVTIYWVSASAISYIMIYRGGKVKKNVIRWFFVEFPEARGLLLFCIGDRREN